MEAFTQNSTAKSKENGSLEDNGYINNISCAMQISTESNNCRFKMNDDAKLYQSSNGIPRRDAVNFLEQYKSRINFKRCKRALDIGCGDGSVTSILRSYLPSTYKKLVGCDINRSMVKHATEHYGDTRTTFRELDIEGALPMDMLEAYDHVFSFYTLHWLRNQELGFTNIYKVLNNGGNCLLAILGSAPTYSIFEALEETNKWKPYLKNVKQYVSPYHNIQEPDRIIKEMMERIGFKDIDIRCKQMLYYYDSIQSFRETTKAINPFRLPDILYEDFINDYIEMTREMRLTETIGGSTVVKMKYNLIVIFARK